MRRRGIVGAGGGQREPDYLRFIANSASTVGMTSTLPTFPDIQYSLNDSDWETFDGSSIRLNAGDEIRFFGTNNTLATSTSVYSKFSITGNVEVRGNLLTLLGKRAKGFNRNYCFSHLFSDCTGITKIVDFSIPTDTITSNCFEYMFNNCTGLVSVEDLVLLAETLPSYCYNYMFYNCTNLVSVPIDMLAAKSVGNYSCHRMFYSCKKLVVAPTFKFTTVGQYGCGNMFSVCSSLTTVSALLPTVAGNACYSYMFSNCTSLVTAPKIYLANFNNACAPSMFFKCSKLNYVEIVATAFSNQTSWLAQVSASGTFKKPQNTNVPSGTGGIPTGWTVINV